MLGLVGAVPKDDFPLLSSTVTLEGDMLIIGENRIAVNRGTPAMIAAAVTTLELLERPAPHCYLVGDVGSGGGCKDLYRHLSAHLPGSSFDTLAPLFSA